MIKVSLVRLVSLNSPLTAYNSIAISFCYADEGAQRAAESSELQDYLKASGFIILTSAHSVSDPID